jgi:DNA-directed RNA polymerase III subunit RPC8
MDKRRLRSHNDPRERTGAQTARLDADKKANNAKSCIMFEVERITDSIQMDACDLGKPTAAVLARKIDERYPNRVLPQSGGLVICRYDNDKEPTVILSSGGICKEGKTYWTIEFSVIVFRPFIGEILVGTIAESNSSGIRVTLGSFFGALYIPAYWMLRPSSYDDNTNMWVWWSDDERYEMPVGATIRVRVKNLHYTKSTVTAAKGGQVEETSTTMLSGRKRSSSFAEGDDNVSAAVPSAMYITASICEDGLGLTEWWQNAGPEDEDDDGEEVEAEEAEEDTSDE